MSITWREADIVAEMDRAIDLGVVGASAVVVDGGLMSPALPKPEALHQELLRRLEHGGRQAGRRR